MGSWPLTAITRLTGWPALAPSVANVLLHPRCRDESSRAVARSPSAPGCYRARVGRPTTPKTAVAAIDIPLNTIHSIDADTKPGADTTPGSTFDLKLMKSRPGLGGPGAAWNLGRSLSRAIACDIHGKNHHKRWQLVTTRAAWIPLIGRRREIRYPTPTDEDAESALGSLSGTVPLINIRPPR